MDRLKMAHEYALEMLKETIPTGSLYGDEARSVAESIVKSAFALADMMQAEADERSNKERPDVLLTKDKDGNCLHLHHEFGHKKCMDCGASLGEWQPDWSHAPTNELEELNYWCMDENGDSWWFSLKPRAKYGQWNSKDEAGLAIKAPSFNYSGNWQDSLRKRPSNI